MIMRDLRRSRPSISQSDRHCGYEMIDTAQSGDLAASGLIPFQVVDANDYTIRIANSSGVPRALAGATTCYAFNHGLDKPCRDGGAGMPHSRSETNEKAGNFGTCLLPRDGYG